MSFIRKNIFIIIQIECTYGFNLICGLDNRIGGKNREQKGKRERKYMNNVQFDGHADH